MQPVDDLNDLSRDEFSAALKPLFETAPPLADALYANRPYSSYATLIDTAESLAEAMPFEAQVAVLSAHPRIGANPQTLSAASYREQGYTRQPEGDGVNATLSELNEQYEQKFGFRFVIFVNGRPRSEIIDVLRERLQGTREDELATGLHEMFRIARARLSTS